MMRISPWFLSGFAAVALFASTHSAVAQPLQATASQLEFFEKNIRPALIKYCYECHSLESGTTRGGLMVDTREGLMTGGDSGPALSPGNTDESLLWEAINWDSFEMPPSQKMPRDVIEHFRTWIEMGAPDPRIREKVIFESKLTPELIEQGKQHWAFQPPQRSDESSVDALIDNKLRDESLTAVGPADAHTLLRRLHFDLTGLPPSPKEVSEFQAAWTRNRRQAIEAKVDDLLARPQFGERWGRHWLDAARYADTSGNVNVAYPYAWRYRDYVIDAFNNDKPYDRFIQEQIAGDLLPVETDEQWQQNLIATGFLAVGMKRHDERNPRKFAMDMVDEQIDTMTQSILGVTVACARCHDHKSDPIPTADYYSLAGIMLSTKTLYGTIWGQQNHRPSDLLLLPVLDANAGSGDQSIAEIEQQIEQLRAQMRRMNAAARESGERVQREFVSMRNRIAKLEGVLTTLNPDGTKKTFGMGVQESDKMVNASILVGGDVERPAQDVPRGFLQVLNDVPSDAIQDSSSGRRELADWMTSPQNPLTARVMVNRVWMHLFGAPIVGTPNNWGPTGMLPTHPEMLDHLAVRFMDENWSVKSLIRSLVLTDAYQRSSAYVEKNAEVDPDNKFLWRMSPRQLDAEAMRDAMLAASGRLDLSRPRSSVVDWGDGRVDRGRGSQERFNELSNYRSVYLPVIRDAVYKSLELFGFPDPNIASAGRRESIVPTQALYVMNGEFVIGQAAAMADQMLAASSSLDDQIKWAFLTAYGRPASAGELRASVNYLRQQASSASSAPSASGSEVRGRRRPDGVGGPAGRARRPNSQNGPGRGRLRPMAQGFAAGSAPQQNQSSAERQALMLFCQTLLASAEFRILN